MTDHQRKPEEQGDVVTMTKPKVKQPSFYTVIMLNDDYTTMDFVIHVLKKFFNKSHEEANTLMLAVHHKGRAVCGLYPYDVASTKIVQVHEYARKNEAPLKCIMEKA
ncbi:MAG: ATP-dependent Clp protease adapter ClpS [Deltaproteobacteria bacterium]|nr:ATP-dependent Clp protease adapter ClpS [Deltaproteobacteria bacterium]